MPFVRPFFRLAAFVGLAVCAAAPGLAQTVSTVTNTGRLSYDAPGGRRTVDSNTVSLDVARTKRPTSLSFRLLPVGYQLSGMQCQTSPTVKFVPAPVDEATLAAAPPVAALDVTQPMFLVLDAEGENRDPNVRETATISVDTETYHSLLPLLETGPNTGVFAGGIPNGNAYPEFRACDPTLVRGEHIRLSFGEDEYSYGSSTSQLIDPAGFVFDSRSGVLVDGATVTLIDESGQPAVVYGDDGTSRYPATVVSGAGTKDASGRQYDFSQGNYRFPLVAPGKYRLSITPPADYTAPSTRSRADLAQLRDPDNLPFIINDASFGADFIVPETEPFFTDVPLDRTAQTSLLLSKVASVREASAGDFVQYKVTIANRGTSAASDVRLTDILPTGLRYQVNSTRGVPEPTVTGDGRTLAFTVPTVAPAASLELTYVVAITPNAPVGEALNRVTAAGGGITSNEADASVRITPFLFTDGFTILGRVTEGDCLTPPARRKGIPGVRILLEDGTYITTDRDGFYHFEGVRPGRHVIALDKGSISAAYEPARCDNDTRSAGSATTRFVESAGGLLQRVDWQLKPTGKKAAAADPLPVKVASDGEAAGDRNWLKGLTAGAPEILFPTPDYNPRAPVTRVVVRHLPGQKVALFLNGVGVDPVLFDTSETSDDKTVAISRWTGLSLVEGDNKLEARIIDASGAVVTTLTRIVHSGSIAYNAEFVAAASRLVADGYTRPMIAVRLTDRAGRPVRAGTAVPFAVDQPYAAALDLALESGKQQEARGAAIARVVGDDGIAFITLQPTTSAGAVRATVTLTDDKQTRSVDVRAWLAAGQKDWIVVGFGAGTLGYDTLKSRSSALPRSERNKVTTDGQLAFYAKGRILGSWLLTMAYDSDRVRNRDRGLLGTIDPDKYYTVYGDGTQQGYDAATAGKLYVRLERKQFYALFGDFETGLTDTQLTRYSRTFNGFKTGYGGKRFGFTAFAAKTDQLYARDEIQGNGLTGPYRLSGRDIVPNSDKLRIEVRDRLRPEIVLSSTAMERHIDYDIDTALGTIRFRQPVLGRDAANNPVIIVADYETYGTGKKLAAGGRIAVNLAGGKIQLGASALRDETVSSNATVLGVDFKARLPPTLDVRAEAAVGGRFGLGKGRAFLAEIEQHTKRLDMLVYGGYQDLEFGIGQQNRVQPGTLKFGLDGRLRLTDRLSIAATAWREEQLNGPGRRVAGDVRLEMKRKNGTVFVGSQLAYDTGIDGEDRKSVLLTAGGTQSLLKGRLTLTGQVQIAPGGDKASVDFPIRDQLIASFRVTDSVRLIAGYEYAVGKDFTAHTAQLGFDVTPWKGAKLTSTLNNQVTGENASRVYAQYGLAQTLKLSKHWTVDFTVDASSTVKGKIPAGAVVVPFATTGSGSIAGDTYGNDGDYVAVTGGAGFRSGPWAWNGRLEYRRSDQSIRWGLTTDLLRSLGEGRTLAGSVKAYTVTDKDGRNARYATADLALAVRPPDSRWSILERLQFRDEKADAGFTDTNVLGVPAYGNGFQATFRAINNLAVNYRTATDAGGAGFEATVYYGAKWVRGSFGADDYTGFTDAIGFDIRKDLGTRFDLGLQGSVQHAWTQQVVSFSGGPTIGFSPAANLWLTAGYNIAGYRDRDFEDDRYTRSGPYLTLRIKFDAGVLGGIGQKIIGGRK